MATTFEFDRDNNDATYDYFLVAEEGSIDSSGYGSFLNISGTSAWHGHYTNAARYTFKTNAEQSRDFYEAHSGKTFEVIFVEAQ
jgi:hypothetical protein